jgi:hypothetical protein
MSQRSSQPLTEMSTRNLPGGKERPARKADNLTAICEATTVQHYAVGRIGFEIDYDTRLRQEHGPS